MSQSQAGANVIERTYVAQADICSEYVRYLGVISRGAASTPATVALV